MITEYFHGYALNAVDAKNRLSIPSSYRDVVELRSAKRAVVLGPHETEPCLVGYDTRRSERIDAEIALRFKDSFGPERDDLARRLFGASELAPYDDTGRIVLSPTLKELGEIERLAFFIAAGDKFEIWNPEVLLEAKGASDPRLARIVRRQLEAKA